MKIPEKAIKLLRLALCDSAHGGERANAAVAFVVCLKRAGITADDFEEKVCRPADRGQKSAWSPPKSKPPPPTAQPPPTDAQGRPLPTYGKDVFTVMPFGKHKGIALAYIDNGYILWLFNECELRGARFKEAVLEELKARGL